MALAPQLKIEEILPLVNWEGAKYHGTIQFGKTVLYYRWRSKKVTQPFPFEKYGGKELALAAANEFQREYCRRNGGTYNEYGFANLKGQSVGVLKLLHNQFMFFSPQHLAFVTEYTWCAYRGRRTWYATAYMKVKQRNHLFHQLVLPIATEIDHIDHNGLNNTLENIVSTSHHANMLNTQRQVNNTSGVKGVNLHIIDDRRNWVATWEIHGEKHRKSFAVKKYGEEGAFQRALAIRQAANEKHGFFPG